MKQKLHVVTNLEVSQVSWAAGFCNSAYSAGATIVTPEQAPANVPKLYIGDEVPWDQIHDPGLTGYFLAAVDGTAQEQINVERAAMTTTPSMADYERAQRMLAGSRVFVDGFPLNLAELDLVRSNVIKHQKGRVGFVGRTDIDKGVDAELALAAVLKKRGIQAVHLSSASNTISAELTALGVEVLENLTREQYLGRLAYLGCVVNTSPRESLFVSGLEASRLGVPVVAPLVEGSGITDWNMKDRFYRPDNFEAAADMIEAAIESDEVPDVTRYSASCYVNRVGERIERLEEER